MISNFKVVKLKVEFKISNLHLVDVMKFIIVLCNLDSQVTILTKQLASLEVEVINKKQYCDHLNRMSELTKGKLIFFMWKYCTYLKI